jgi:hypothetical protein
MAGFPFVSLSPARLLNLKNSFANNINFYQVIFPMMDMSSISVSDGKLAFIKVNLAH